MSAASVFDFPFTAENATEGGELATAVGHDMTLTEGYERHDVIRDVSNPAHVAVITFWHTQAQGEAVLDKYMHDDKIARATALIGAAPTGFLGLAD
ncbi:hypothetical protein [Agreia sp.]|uniref:hypothetical protein n=1 Tax=Agreia sp. TaxID=1872416 RepID=UPI0035BC3822